MPALRKWSLRALVAVVAFSGFAPVAQAQKPTDAIPDALLYYGWAGSDAVAQPFAETGFGKVWNEPSVQQLVQRAIPAVEAWIREQGGTEEREAFDLAMRVGKVLLRKPVSFAVLDVAMGPQGPDPQIVLCVRAGDDAGMIDLALQRVCSMVGLPPATPEEIGGHSLHRIPVPQSPFSVLHGVVGDAYVLAVGDTALNRVMEQLEKGSGGLTANPRFAAGLKHLSPGGAPVSEHLFLDFGGLLNRGLEIAEQMGAQLPEPVKVLLNESGIRKVGGISVGVAMKDGGFRRSLHVQVEGMQKYATPMSPDDLVWVPKDTNFFTLTRFDVAGWVNEILRWGELVAPYELKNVREQLAQFEQQLGFRVVEDLLGSLGDQFLIYEDPTLRNMFLPALNIVLKPKDPKKLAFCVERIVAMASQFAAQEGAEVKHMVEGEGDSALHYVQVNGFPMPIAPAWKQLGSDLVISMHPVAIQDALYRRNASNARELSILANADFQRGAALMPQGAHGLGYVDTAASVREIYPWFVYLGQMGISMLGGDMRASLIPPSHAVCRHMFGDVGCEVITDDGFLLTGHGPMPISLPSFGGVTTISFLAGLLVPTVNAARAKAERAAVKAEQMREMAELHQLSKYCQMWAGDNDNKFPRRLDELKQKFPDSGSLVWGVEYIGGQMMTDSGDNVLMYGSGNYDGTIAVVFVDGRVETQPYHRAMEMVRQTRSRLENSGK